MTSPIPTLWTSTSALTPVEYDGRALRLGVGALLQRGAGPVQARSGVLSGDSLVVTQTGTASMAVQVGAGSAAVQGIVSTGQGAYVATFDAATTVPIAAAHATLPRRDLVALRVYDVDDGTPVAGAPDYGAELVVIPGTPAASPVRPALPTDGAGAIELAQVQVNAGATTITNANITDLRVKTVASGGVLRVQSSLVRPTLEEGQIIWEESANRLYYSDGSGWRRLDPTRIDQDVSTQQSTTSTVYTNLSTVGPTISSVHLEAGQSVAVEVYAYEEVATSGPRLWMSFQVSGASTQSPDDANAAKNRPAGPNTGTGTSKRTMFTASGTGLHTFQAKYRVDSGTGFFSDRRISVEF